MVTLFLLENKPITIIAPFYSSYRTEIAQKSKIIFWEYKYYFRLKVLASEKQ